MLVRHLQPKTSSQRILFNILQRNCTQLLQRLRAALTKRYMGWVVSSSPISWSKMPYFWVHIYAPIHCIAMLQYSFRVCLKYIYRSWEHLKTLRACREHSLHLWSKPSRQTPLDALPLFLYDTTFLWPINSTPGGPEKCVYTTIKKICLRSFPSLTPWQR